MRIVSILVHIGNQNTCFHVIVYLLFSGMGKLGADYGSKMLIFQCPDSSGRAHHIQYVNQSLNAHPLGDFSFQRSHAGLLPDLNGKHNCLPCLKQIIYFRCQIVLCDVKFLIEIVDVLADNGS